MHRTMISTLLLLFFSFNSAYAMTPGSGATFQYSNDSDGVTTRAFTYSSSHEDQEKPFAYKLGVTQIEQAAGRIKEYSFIGQWRKQLPGSQSWTVWGGAARNDIYTFIPYALMYDKATSPKEHIWISYGHEAVGTVEAYEDKIHTDSYAVSYLNQVNNKTNFTASVRRVNYSDNNRETIWNAEIERRFTRRFKTSLGYGYDNAATTNPGKYYVPQGERAWFIKPEFTTDIGIGTLTVGAEQALTAHNNVGNIKRYSWSVNYQVNGFSAGYTFKRDNEYTSKNYKVGYQAEW